MNGHISREQAAEITNNLYVGMRQGLRGVDEQTQSIAETIVANGHALLEGIPGTGKTTITSSIEDILLSDQGNKTVGRFQGVNDALPSDVTGSVIYNQKTGDFEPRLGPVNAHIFFADEINRAPDKTQNAINQSAQEGAVTLDGITYNLPKPFVLLATQNSHEPGQATNPTTSALLDRFTSSIYFGAPSTSDLIKMGQIPNLEKELMSDEQLKERDALFVKVTTGQLLSAMRVVAMLPIEDEAVERLVSIHDKLVDAKGVSLISGGEDTGMGFRFIIRGARLAKANAVRNGKAIATAQNVDAVASNIFAHRIRSIGHNSHTAHPNKLQAVADAMKK